MRQHFFSVATLASFIAAQRPEESHHDRTTNRLSGSLSPAVKLFEIDPQDIKPEARLYEVWNWTASTPLT